MSAVEIGGALVMGLMGSVHCVAMCGPIAAVLCASRRAETGGRRTHVIVPHLGRIGTYALLGAVGGAAGRAISDLLPVAVVQLGARVLAAVLLLAVGLYAAGFLRSSFARLEAIGAPPFKRLSRRLAPGGAPKTGWARVARGLVQGAIWGLVPCGLVYGALGLALLAGSPSKGALVMLAFGAGTLPSMLLVGIFAGGFQRLVRDTRVRRGAGLLIAVAGTVHLALAFQWGGAAFAPRATVAPAAPYEDTAPPGERVDEAPVRPSCH